jgi:lipoate-protein ligase A
MQYLDSTFPSPSQNLACDELLLQRADKDIGENILRFWSPAEYFIVLGYSNKMHSETNLNQCKSKGVPIMRRCSGGGTVMQGPGCLNYSLILHYDDFPECKNLSFANRFVMNRQREAMQRLLSKEVSIQGHTDLTIEDLKFSGNAQRCGKEAFLFHGTILFDFDISFMEQFLALPSLEPEYRKKRKHSEFLINFPDDKNQIQNSIQSIWKAEEPFVRLPLDEIDQLAHSKYSQTEWIEKF